MKTRSILLLLVMLIISTGISNAQFGALRKAINKQIDNKIDSSADKKAQENRDQQANDQAGQNKPESGSQGNSGPKKGVGMFGGKIDIKYKDNYDFTGRIYMVMEMFDKKGGMKSDNYAYFNEGSKDVGMEMQTVDPKDKKTVINTAIIFDGDSRAFMTLMSGESKFGTISSVPSDSALAAQAKANADKKKSIVTKTGNTKVVAGYKCDEYKVVEPDHEGYSLAWLTKDLKIKSDTRYWGNNQSPSFYDTPGLEGAVMLAMEGYDKDNQLTMKMETKEINEHYKHSISTVGYTFTKMNLGMGRQTKK
jgi:hypothetical protein